MNYELIYGLLTKPDPDSQLLGLRMMYLNDDEKLRRELRKRIKDSGIRLNQHWQTYGSMKFYCYEIIYNRKIKENEKNVVMDVLFLRRLDMPKPEAGLILENDTYEELENVIFNLIKTELYL